MIRFDAIRILAETCHAASRQGFVKPTLDKLPEIYFTKLELVARLLEGRPSLDAAKSQLIVSLEHMLSMLLKAENYLSSDNPEESRAYIIQLCALREGCTKAHNLPISFRCIYDVQQVIQKNFVAGKLL